MKNYLVKMFTISQDSERTDVKEFMSSDLKEINWWIDKNKTSFSEYKIYQQI